VTYKVYSVYTFATFVVNSNIVFSVTEVVKM